MCSLMVLWSASAWAQAEAPVEWNDGALLQTSPPEYSCMGIFCHGDTIVLHAAVLDSTTFHYYPAFCITTDNGISFGPWQVLGELGVGWYDAYARVEFPSTAIVAFAQGDVYGNRGFYATTDLGVHWQVPTSIPPLGVNYQCMRNDTLFMSVYDGSDPGATWTTDLGRSYAPPLWVNWGEAHLTDLAVSARYLHAVSTASDHTIGYALRYTWAPLYGGPFEPVRYLNPDYFMTWWARLDSDEDGTIILATATQWPFFDAYGLVLNVSHDDGATWSAPDTVVTSLASRSELGLTHWGRQWLVYWCDMTPLPGTDETGLWCRFSANGGRSWYPNQGIAEVSWGVLAAAELRPGRARIHVTHSLWQGVEGWHFLQWEGTITPDTLAPVIAQASSLPELVPCQSPVSFSCTAVDDDSLWQLQVVIRHRWDPSDSTLLDLARQNDSGYALDWTTPSDTAQYLYYYRAEDMWEHVTVYPEGEPWVLHVGAITALDSAFILHSSAFILSCAPNPFNSTTRIRFELPAAGPVTLAVYDLLGRQVAVLADGVLPAGHYERELDGSVLASGLYILRLSGPNHTVCAKIALVK